MFTISSILTLATLISIFFLYSVYPLEDLLARFHYVSLVSLCLRTFNFPFNKFRPITFLIRIVYSLYAFIFTNYDDRANAARDYSQFQYHQPDEIDQIQTQRRSINQKV